MKIQAGLPAGVSALFFEAAAARRRLESRLGATLEQSGYQEVLLPILDYFDPYAELLGTAEKEQLYRFVDRDGQLLALRSDFTPLLARLLAPRLHTLQLPLRCFYRGDVVRYQRTGPGQLREAAQLGAEIFTVAGDVETSVAADAELLALFADLVDQSLGDWRGDPVVVVLGVSRAFDEVEEEPAVKASALRALAQRDRRAAKRLGERWCDIVADGQPASCDWLGPRVASRVEALINLQHGLAARLDARRLEFRIDLAEFVGEGRNGGIDHSYYDGLVFRAFAPGVAPPIGSGGRYDSLFEELGCRAAAAGFSLSLDLLVGLGDQKPHQKPHQEPQSLRAARSPGGGG